MRIITKNQERDVIHEYAKGKSGLLIAHILNLSVNQVYDALKRNNVACRNSRERLESIPLSFKFLLPLAPEKKKLFVAGIMLYLGEGAKNGVTVDLANSNVCIIKIFLRFLKDIFHIDETKLRFYLYCFQNQNPDKLIIFWANQLGVPVASFTKPYIRRKNSGKHKRIATYGVLHVRYNDKRLLEKILDLCSDLTEELLENQD